MTVMIDENRNFKAKLNCCTVLLVIIDIVENNNIDNQLDATITVY